jgi:hypothetical protein
MKLKLAVGEMSEQLIVNPETDSNNSSSDTDETGDGEISAVRSSG